MAFTLQKVVPWGRSFDEYRRMFNVTEFDLRKNILGCADGPASFNAELTAAGGTVVSCDPLYCFDREDIQRRIDDTSPEVIEQARKNMDEFVWSDRLPDVETLSHYRRATMRRFLGDYGAGRLEGRYVVAELPTLPFEADSFDLAVCSHFLFLYSGKLTAHFHIESIRSLIRVADEVRIFPLLELGAILSRHIELVTTALRGDGYQVVIEVVDYEFQRGGNQMMRVLR